MASHREDRLAHRTPEDRENYRKFREELWRAIDKRAPCSVVALARKYKQR